MLISWGLANVFANEFTGLSIHVYLLKKRLAASFYYSLNLKK
ncbi:hypothetical protein SGODD07_00171 [Streptococcus gordonii]|uniref:Uncharacterized protein n=1 Tax=Streptococcus gordonii TaxID=1302 RepID=A0A139NEV6_STRGN|nr:hypothetical protein SGODD07_00171 [Streptococcus gordonii]